MPECVVCEDNECNVLFLPCAHLFACERCAGILFQKTKPICSICLASIESRQTVYY